MGRPRSLAALAALFALAACGGGDGGPPPSPPPPGHGDAVLRVTLAGGASPGVDHLWVTVTGLAMHASTTAVLGDGDPGWVVISLPAPVTVDLADPGLSQGQSVTLLNASVTQVGSYAQLRLILAPPDPKGALLSSASAKGLAWNDQVQYTDGTGAHTGPLEVPDPSAGLRVLTSFSLSSDTTTPLALEWNAHSSLVRRASTSGTDRFAIRDELQAYNQQLLTALGDGSLQIAGSLFDSISGQLDTSQFCTGPSRANCIHDVVASATSLAPDGRFHQEVRSVNVAADGSFLLYPLPTETLYDVVIHGGNMQTIVVRGVFVDPTGLLKPVPTVLSSKATPLVPVLDTGERQVAVANALAPAGSRVLFGQTVPGSGGTAGDVPYVIAHDAADPATGRVLHAVTLPAGPLHDAKFDPATQGTGTPPTFTTVLPVEGAGGYSAWATGTLADDAGARATLAPAATTISVPDPVRAAGFADGTLTVTLGGSSSNHADHAELVVTNDGGIVSVTDVSGLVAAHGGTVALTLPSGTAAAHPAAAVYRVALRTWVAGAEDASTLWSRASGLASLATAATGTATVAIP